jgi:hypothetical protein
MADPDHPLVRLALRLVTRPSPEEPALTDDGREQLRTELRACVQQERREAALALLELAYFLAKEGHARAAEAIGAVVAAEAGEELTAWAAEQQGRTEPNLDAAKKLLGTPPSVHAKTPPPGIGRRRARK